MRIYRRTFLIQAMAPALAAVVFTGCASGPKRVDSAAARAKLEPAALELLNSVSANLGGAQTIQLEATHKLDPALGLGLRIDRGPIELVVKRPNQFYAIQPAGSQTREIAYDGNFLCVMHPGPKHHALESLEAKTIEQFAQLVDERFGFRPPLAELLANDMAAELLIDVTSARLLGRERVGWTSCDHLRFDQPGMSIDLWVATKDKLPRRMLITVTEMRGNPTWDIHLSKWKLNEPLDESLFSKRPASDSQKVQLLKSR